ncbi:hypothetical protein B7Z28_00330, partial [Candidatus Saccharibacteria bacterium 32-45-3]
MATALIVGIASQEIYTDLSESIQTSSREFVSGGIGKVGEAAALLAGTITSNLNGAVTPEAQTYAV